jgi:hypothetical protein
VLWRARESARNTKYAGLLCANARGSLHRCSSCNHAADSLMRKSQAAALESGCSSSGQWDITPETGAYSLARRYSTNAAKHDQYQEQAKTDPWRLSYPHGTPPDPSIIVSLLARLSRRHNPIYSIAFHSEGAAPTCLKDGSPRLLKMHQAPQS